MHSTALGTPIATSLPTDEFRALYRANYGFVWHTVRRFGVDDAGVDDALQETFLTAYRRLDRWHGGSPKSWLYAIARRVASNHRRASNRRLQRDGAWEVAARNDVADARELDALHIIDRFMHELSAADREAFVLSELEGLGGAEVASVLGIPASTAYDRIRSVRQRFAQHVQERDSLLARARAQRPRATAQAWALLVARLPTATTPMPWWASQWAAAKAAIATVAAATVVAVAGANANGANTARPADVAPNDADGAARSPARDGATADKPAVVAELPASPSTSTVDVHAPAIAPTSANDDRSGRRAPSSPRSDRSDAPAIELAASEPTAPSPSTSDETTWLTDAAERLRSGDAAGTLALTDRHASAFPTSALADVRRELRIESLCALGRGTEGRREAAAWIRRSPRSPIAARAAAACESVP